MLSAFVFAAPEINPAPMRWYRPPTTYLLTPLLVRVGSKLRLANAGLPVHVRHGGGEMVKSSSGLVVVVLS